MFAQSLRLDVKKETRDPVELKAKRQIWWCVVFLDVESTAATGLPPIIHHTRYTTQLPSLLQGHAIPARIDSVPRPGNFSPMMTAMQGHHTWTPPHANLVLKPPLSRRSLSFQTPGRQPHRRNTHNKSQKTNGQEHL
jgi:hypothetical protein